MLALVCNRFFMAYAHFSWFLFARYFFCAKKTSTLRDLLILTYIKPMFMAIPYRILIGDHITSHGHLISYLNISESRVEDGGVYTCSCTNRNGSTAHSARLNIYGKYDIHKKSIFSARSLAAEKRYGKRH